MRLQILSEPGITKVGKQDLLSRNGVKSHAECLAGSWRTKELEICSQIKTRKLDSLPPIHSNPSRKVSPVLRRAASAFAIRVCHYYSSPMLIIEKIPSFGIRYWRAMQS